MRTVQTTAKAGDDGILHIEVPVGWAGFEFEVVVVLRRKRPEAPPTPAEKLSWAEFIEQTAGCWEGEFVRDQGRFEEREGL